MHERVHDEFLERLVARAKTLRVGSGLDATISVGPLVSAKQLEKVKSYVQIGR